MFSLRSKKNYLRIMLLALVCLLFSDLYTFDTSIETAKETYKLVCDSYDRIFDRLGLPFIQGKLLSSGSGGLHLF